MCKATWEFKELKWPHPLLPIAIVRQAIDNQQTLGGEFLLQEYLLTIDWLAAIQENNSDKPKLLLTHLYVGL